MRTGFNPAEARSLLEESGLDCVVATSHDNVYYTTHSEIMTISMLKRLAAAFIPLDGDPTFGVHANEIVTARNTTWIGDLRVYEGGEWEPLKPIKFVADILREIDLGDAKIGIEMEFDSVETFVIEGNKAGAEIAVASGAKPHTQQYFMALRDPETMNSEAARHGLAREVK